MCAFHIDFEEIIAEFCKESLLLTDATEQEESFLHLENFSFSLNDTKLQFEHVILGFSTAIRRTAFTNIIHVEKFLDRPCPLCNKPAQFISETGEVKQTICSFATKGEVQSALFDALDQLVATYAIDFTLTAQIQHMQPGKVELKLDEDERIAYFVEFICTLMVGGKQVEKRYELTFRAGEFLDDKEDWYWDDMFFFVETLSQQENERIKEEVVNLTTTFFQEIIDTYIFPNEQKEIERTTVDVIDVQFDSHENEYLIWFRLNNEESVLIGTTSFQSRCPGDIYICFDNGKPYQKETFSYMALRMFSGDTCITMRNHLMHLIKKEMEKMNAYRLKTLSFQIPNLHLYERMQSERC